MKTKIGVFFGGRSVEHEISIISALQAINAFDKDKYTITPVYITKKGLWYTGDVLFDMEKYKDIDSLLQQCEEVFMHPAYKDFNIYRKKNKLFGGKNIITSIDVAFPILHGTNGEDGIFQGLLELIGIPFVGCNTVSSANGMDKIYMKMILKENQIPVIDYVWFTGKEWFLDKERIIKKIEKQLGYPLIIKPANLGSSVGITAANDSDSLIQSVAIAEKFAERIIVEKRVVNIKEINCSVLGDYAENSTSVCEEPLKSGEILSYEDKYISKNKSSSKGMQSTKRRMPADLPSDMTEKIQHYASETFRVLSCSGVSRIDFIIDENDHTVYINEINTIPGSLSFYLWEATNLSFKELMDKLVKIALKREREVELKTYSYEQNIFNLKGGMKGGMKQ